ncbi:hypothetical protein EJ04DRAFT_510136 [Polyplosphaeria fusca]|uniref:Uncharacterized protein n=1 Tax=Polyplosphaeria fusca TaxID=682080 RepID=A0A9P4R1Z9_9PLEO|nr:hypothetical protein EJ04DRAFT_510136 [Polyplosphaeria fusca]
MPGSRCLLFAPSSTAPSLCFLAPGRAAVCFTLAIVTLLSLFNHIRLSIGHCPGLQSFRLHSTEKGSIPIRLLRFTPRLLHYTPRVPPDETSYTFHSTTPDLNPRFISLG